MCEIIVVTSGKGGVGKTYFGKNNCNCKPERRRRQDNDYSQSWRRSKSAWEESVND